MAQKGLTIYTPAATAAHIYAEDEAQQNRAKFGESGITGADNMLACTKINNNTVRLASGLYCMQGYLLTVPGGSTEDLSVDSGTSGMHRRDLVVAEFVRGGGGTADSFVFKVIKGTPAASAGAAADPTLTQNDLSAGGTTRQEAVYRLTITESTLSAITRIAPYIGNFYA